MRYVIGSAFVAATLLIAAAPVGGATSSPSPAPTSTSTPFTILIRVSSANPSSTPQPTIVPIKLTENSGEQVIYVFAIAAPGEDPSTTNKMLAGVSEKLRGIVPPKNDTLIPMPGWSIADFADACHEKQSDYTVKGGLVIRVFSVSHWITHRIFEEARTTSIDADALYVQCDNNSLEITWHDSVEYTLGTTRTTNLAPFALLFPAIATYQGFIAGRTQETQYTNKEDNTMTTTTTTYNPAAASNAGQVAGALVTASVSYSQALVSTPPPTSDEATWIAVNELSAQIVADTACPTPIPSPTPNPSSASPSPIPNPTPTLPPALPGTTGAPFCRNL